MPLLLFLLLLILNTTAQAQSYDPSSDWRTLDTTHFRFHYPAELTAVARELAPIAESVHNQLVGPLRWQPEQPTEVVLADETDRSNGHAGPIPFNQVHLVLRQPELGVISDPQSRRHWLRFVFIHEYVHVLHLDKVSGAPAALREVFGRLLPLFPPLLAPRFWHEGLATDFETRLDPGYGRGLHPEFSMLMRAEASQGLRSLGAIANPKRHYPGEILNYSYGVYFFQFLRQHYGDDRLGEWLDAYADNLVPFRVNATMRQVFEQDLRELWVAFTADLQQRFDDEQTRRSQAGLIQGQALTHGGLTDRGVPQPMADGSVLFVRDDQHHHTALLQRTPNGEISVLRDDLLPGARIRANGHTTIVAQPQPCGLFRTYYDLYRLEANGDWHHISHCQRYSEAAPSPDGRQIVAVRHPGGQSEVVLLSRDGELLRQVAASSGEQYFSQPLFAPDGDHLLFVVSDAESGAKLREFDLNTAEQRDYPLNGHPPRGLSYSPDGQSIWLSEAVDDVYEIIHLDRRSGQRQVITRSRFGALAPSVTANGEVLYKAYGPQGFDLWQLSPEQQQARAAPAPRANPAPELPQPLASLSDRPYRPWSTLAPRYWFPYAYVDDEATTIGAVTGGADALNQHRYQVTLARDLDNGEWVGNAWYQFSEYLTLIGARTDESRTRDGDFARVRQTDQAGLVLSWPWRLPDSRLTAQVGANYKQQRDIEVDPVVGVRPLNYRANRVAGFNLMYDSSHEYRYSLGPVDGRRLALTVEGGRPLGGDYTGEVYQLRWYEYIQLGGDHSLELTAWYGRADDDAEPFQLGGTGDPLWPGWQMMPFAQRDIPLRGYDSDEFALLGERGAHISANWRFPLAIPEWGTTVPPLGLNRLSGTLFVESGAAWNRGESLDEHYDSVGAELVLDAAAGYLLPLRLRLGVAYGLDADLGETQAYALLQGVFF